MPGNSVKIPLKCWENIIEFPRISHPAELSVKSEALTIFSDMKDLQILHKSMCFTTVKGGKGKKKMWDPGNKGCNTEKDAQDDSGGRCQGDSGLESIQTDWSRRTEHSRRDVFAKMKLMEYAVFNILRGYLYFWQWMRE